ncbi:ComEC/Rec2 family competence protein [Dysgonomonas sp. 520]|uniref:ComEC/Rec2 family competence protein n=1 Tax=Dysgonomonas sp. 520 TaxID=2302931 RepID=UPI001C87A49A|nr:ComEC/Rec2 family competence protein [Dysgonomonas sp. 520]NDW08833.1 ComEC family competence protein [Dysgonomonas sp. 520]
MPESNIVKSPFFRLLLPLLAGIILQYHLDIKYLSIILFALGIGVMLFSFFLPPGKEYNYRWLFGAGSSLLLIAAGTFSTQLRQRDAGFDFRKGEQSYIGVVLDTPKEKPKSIAIEVLLSSSRSTSKKIVCYIHPNTTSRGLQPGDEIRLYGEIEPFKNTGNPDEFDYAAYMYNKGFSGYVYLPANRWEPTLKTKHTVQTYASKCKAEVLDFYRSLNLNDTQFSIISALTLGYKDEMPDDIKESFRTTGTAHVLATSGLHVGIIFSMIMFLFGFLHRKSGYYKLKFVFIILFLWMYAFLAGLSPSIVRACIMLTIYCFAEIFNRKGFSFNTIFAAAFLMLIFNPFSLFDIGFQLSFMAVISICYLQPKLSKLWEIENKYGRYVWQLFTLSMAAQIGTFALCLYYFGYFPTYFFVTNLFVPILAGAIIYLTIAIFFASMLPFVMNLLIIPLKFIILILTTLIQFFENLPLAKLDNPAIPLASVFLFIILIFSAAIFLRKKKASALIVSLSSIALLILIPLFLRLKSKENELWVLNRKEMPEIRWNYARIESQYSPDSINCQKLISFEGKRILSVSSMTPWIDKHSEEKFHVDYLHLCGNENFTLSSLSEIISFRSVILDATLSPKTSRKLAKECARLNINFYDVREHGAFCIASK